MNRHEQLLRVMQDYRAALALLCARVDPVERDVVRDEMRIVTGRISLLQGEKFARGGLEFQESNLEGLKLMRGFLQRLGG